MKKITLILIAFFAIICSTAAQSVGDYRSVGNGNWNDATKWEIFDGSNWITANKYPGQNSGTGTVTIRSGAGITLTASVPQPIAALLILDSVAPDYQSVITSGVLTFSSENPILLNVQGDVTVFGSIRIEDQNGGKSHLLSIYGSLISGSRITVPDSTCVDYFEYYSCPFYEYDFPGEIRTSNNDDKLAVAFNTTRPGSYIGGVGEITFEDISFNGVGISVDMQISIKGTSNFIHGVVTSSSIFLYDGATVTGASSASFVDGRVWKQGDDPFTFPIGNNGIYSPLTISAPPSPGDIFSARYARLGIDPARWLIVSDPGLYSVSNCEYWELTPGNDYFGTFNNNYPGQIDVTAGWTPLTICGTSYITNVSDVSLAHYNGTIYSDHPSWDSHGGSAMGTTTNGSVTWSGVRNFGYFTLGNINTSCVTPYGLNATNVTSNSATFNWATVPGALSYDVSYKPSYSGWSIMKTATTSSTSLNIPELNPVVTYDWKVTANCSGSSSASRLGPQITTQNPCGTPSGLLTTNITSSGAKLSWSSVPGSGNYTIQYKQSSSDSWIDAAISTSSRSVNLTGLAASTAYDWRVVAFCYYSPTYTTYGSGAAQASFTTAAFSVCNDSYEPNDISAQAKIIRLETAISANISSAADVDWFKLTTPNNANTSLRVTLNNLPADYDVYLYNKNLTLVASSTNVSTSNETLTYSSNARKATYYIKVAGKNGAYNASQCYNLLVQAVGSGGSITRVSEPLNESDGLNVQLLYPNPASEFVQLSFNSVAQGKSDVQIVNTVGQLVKQHPINIANGHNQVKIPVKDIRPGMYILKINNDGLSLIKRFVIAR